MLTLYPDAVLGENVLNRAYRQMPGNLAVPNIEQTPIICKPRQFSRLLNTKRHYIHVTDLDECNLSPLWEHIRHFDQMVSFKLSYLLHAK